MGAVPERGAGRCFHVLTARAGKCVQELYRRELQAVLPRRDGESWEMCTEGVWELYRREVQGVFPHRDGESWEMCTGVVWELFRREVQGGASTS